MREGGREGGRERRKKGGEDEVSNNAENDSRSSIPSFLPPSLPHLLNQLLELGVVNPGEPLPVSIESVLAGQEGAAGVGVLGHELVLACEGGKEGGRGVMRL